MADDDKTIIEVQIDGKVYRFEKGEALALWAQLDDIFNTFFPAVPAEPPPAPVVVPVVYPWPGGEWWRPWPTVPQPTWVWPPYTTSGTIVVKSCDAGTL